MISQEERNAPKSGADISCIMLTVAFSKTKHCLYLYSIVFNVMRIIAKGVTSSVVVNFFARTYKSLSH